MGLLIRIQKKIENKLLHKHGEHGKPVYYADQDEEVEETTTARTSSSGPSPASRLNLSFLSSTRRNSTQPQSSSTDIPPRSPSFFCRGSSSQPNARRSLHARNGSNFSTGGGRRSGTWPGQQDSSGQPFRVPAFPDSSYVSRESDPDIGFLPEGDEPLASPSQLGNSMTLGGREPPPPMRGFSGLADRYEAPSAMSPNENFVNGEDSTATATGGLRGFEGDRDEGFFTPVERPVQPARTQTAAPVVQRPVVPARTQTAAPSGDGGRTMRMQIDDARRERRPFTTTRALTGYAYTKGQL